MVVRHARAPLSDFVVLFHMAIFFIASGYLYNAKSALDIKSVGRYILRKIKSLYIPYVAFITVYILLRNIFIQISIYTDDEAFLVVAGVETEYLALTERYSLVETVTQIAKTFVFRGESQQIAGAMWFFQTLFLVLIGYNIIQFIAEHISQRHSCTIQTIVSICLLIIGYYCDLEDISLNGLARVCSVYILIHMGVLFRRYAVLERLFKTWHLILAIALAFLILLFGYGKGNIGIVSNSIVNPIFFIIVSCAGWMLLYGIAKIMVLFKTPFNNAVAYLSQHSVPIIGMHFLCFKIVNYIIVFVYGMEIYMVAAFPVLLQTGAWWILYSLAGILIPLGYRGMVAYCKEWIINKVIKEAYIQKRR